MPTVTKPEPATATHPVTMPHKIDPLHARKAGRALYLIVIVSGAVLMGVEIAGAKILAPGFGTSIFVWGSIIGLFMGALALGYWLGGMAADRQPYFPALAGIVAGAGFWVALIPRFGPDLADAIARQNLGNMAGPLLAAGALFFIPSFLMGMVAPYAVKLNASSLAGLGGVAGRLYAWSTLGSIIGTLLTTFVLIPNLFVSSTMQGLGITLIVISAVSLLWFRSASGTVTRQDHTVAASMALVGLIFGEAWAIAPVQPPLQPSERLLHYQDSSYHEILVTEDVIGIDNRNPAETYDGGTLLPALTWKDPGWDVRRWLKFNANTESGIYPYREKYANAVGYTDLLHLPLIWTGKPKKILVVGGGGAIVPTQYSEWYGAHVDVAEIDKEVEITAKTYFQVPKTEDIHYIIGDGRQTLRQLKDGDYDAVVLDAYSSGGQIPFHLMTWEFMAEVKKKLAPHGVLISNIIAGLRNEPGASERTADLFLAEYKTLLASRNDAKRTHSTDPADTAPLFKQVYVFPKVYASVELTPSNFGDYRNVIIVATEEDQPLSGEQMEDAAKRLSTGSDALVKTDLVWHVQQYELLKSLGCPNAEDLKPLPVLCDDYAPVDTMYRLVRKDETMQRIY